MGYWDFRGLAQPIRFLLVHLGINYEERTFTSNEQWEQTKDKLGLPFPNLPFLIDADNDIYLTDTLAIMKYLAGKYQPALLERNNL